MINYGQYWSILITILRNTHNWFHAGHMHLSQVARENNRKEGGTPITTATLSPALRGEHSTDFAMSPTAPHGLLVVEITLANANLHAETLGS